MYKFSRTELAPAEDQSHISLFFEASPDSTLAATNRDHVKVVEMLAAFPETDFTWSLTSAWGGFGGLVAKHWKERTRSTEEMYGDVFGAISQVSGLRVFPRLDPPLPTPGQYDVELVLQSDAPVERMLETAKAVLEAGWRSGKFLYVDTDLKIDLPEARVMLDREKIADLGLDLAGVGRELGTLLGGDYVNRFSFFDRSYKVIPQIGDEDPATLAPLLDLKIKTPDGQLVPVSDSRSVARPQDQDTGRSSTFTDIETAALTRLRPVLMTSAATVFGHLPLVLVSGPGSEARNSIGTVLVTGMIVGTVFTLFVVPVFYSLIAARHQTVSTETEQEARPLKQPPALAEPALIAG